MGMAFPLDIVWFPPPVDICRPGAGFLWEQGLFGTESGVFAIGVDFELKAHAVSV